MSRGPVEVVADLGTVKVVPFGSDQVQLRCRVKLGRGEPLETVLLLDRARALQIADGLTSGDLAELIAVGRKVCAEHKYVSPHDDAVCAGLALVLGKFR